jgi:hypothetical protein
MCWTDFRSLCRTKTSFVPQETEECLSTTIGETCLLLYAFPAVPLGVPLVSNRQLWLLKSIPATVTPMKASAICESILASHQPCVAEDVFRPILAAARTVQDASAVPLLVSYGTLTHLPEILQLRQPNLLGRAW